jgi:hypothetical protein
MRTYLELSEPAQLRVVPTDPRLRVLRSDPCPVSFYRYLYEKVGRQYHWRDRIQWTDVQIAAYLATPGSRCGLGGSRARRRAASSCAANAPEMWRSCTSDLFPTA